VRIRIERAMYVLKPGVKADPHRQWALPDRIFFGYGACHTALGPRLQLISVENMEHPFKSWMIGLDYITRGTGSRRKN
jgi:hypothetical protein